MIGRPSGNLRLAAAIDAVTAACAVTRRVSLTRGSGALSKGDGSPVTVADFAAQAVISRLLGERLGPIALLGEESGAVLQEAPAHLQATVDAVQAAWPGATAADVLSSIDAGRGPLSEHGFWTVDPVDGTKGFLRGQQYAVALAWVEGGRATVGVLGCPNLARAGRSATVPDAVGTLYFAARGEGAFERTAADEAAPMRALSRRAETPASAPLVLCSSVEGERSDPGDLRRVMDAAGAASEPLLLDSQCKYAVVARGDADAYVRIPRRGHYVERIWDHAAGSLIAEEAGCVVTDVDGVNLDFGRGAALSANRGVVCAAPGAHARVLAALARA